MNEKLNNLVDKFNHGQSYLFLGQDYLSEAITEKYYETISNKLDIDLENKKDLYLELEKSNLDLEKTLEWMQSEADYTTLPNLGKYLAKIHWNGVITSAVEYFVEKMLRFELRDIQPVYQYSKNLPYNFKSKQILHISYLYGCLNQMEKGNRPPMSIFEFSEYSSNALNLLNKINREFLTPLGVLIIDGYNYKTDWLKDEFIYSICSKLSKEQVYFFSFKDEYLNSIYIKKLIEKEIVVPIRISLVAFIEKAFGENLLLEVTEEMSANDLIVSVNGKRRVLPRKKYKSISRTCRVLDDFSFEFDEVESTDETNMFRDFLYRSSIQPVWKAFHYGMNIVRKYENEAYEKIIGVLQNDSLTKAPIIIYGQTGTGKSVALESLAYRLKIEKKYPVLYIDSRTIDVHNTDIEDFCTWCDDIKVAVFWDASTHGNEVSKYIELNNYLASKGKKSVIIGTSYNIDDSIKKAHNAIYIEAPVDITVEEEINSFKEKYEYFTHRELNDVWKEKYDNNFLVALYRLLPSTNYNIRRGLLGEISVDTIDLCEIVTLEEENSHMLKLLQKCGIPVSSHEEQRESNKVSIGKIIKIVSVVGQFGIPIPFDIIFRMLNGEVSYLVGTLLEKIDFLHVETDVNGNINIFPRNSLEAQIVANSSVVTLDERVDLIREIVNNISEKELSFLIALLKAIGPNAAPDNDGFKDYYKEIAEEVKNLRINQGVYNEGTILQEASYIREYFKSSEKSQEDIISLHGAQELLICEIKKIEGKIDSFYLKIFYGQLFIELSSNIGAEVAYYCKMKENIDKITETYKELEKYLETALTYSPDPYYPVDIWAWATTELLKTEISKDKRTECIGKLVSLFEKVITENPEIINRDDYNRRILQVDAFEEQENITEDAFNRLMEMKSDSGIYLRTRKIIKGINLLQKISDSDAKKVELAIEYLEKDEFFEILYNSKKLLYLLFRLKWLVSIGEPIFFTEKKVLSFTKQEWEKIYLILLRIEEISEDISAQIQFLIGITEFHLGKEADSYNHFDEIRNNYYLGVKRPILYYIASEVSGQEKMRSFIGQLKKVEKEKERAKFYIPSLRKSLYYYNREFVSKDPDENVEYEGLHLGFSFMGLRVSDIE